MKPGKIILVSVVGVLCILMAGMIGCKEKKANVERSTDTSPEDYSYEQSESLDESDVISEEGSEIEGYSEKTNKKLYEEDEQEPDDEPNTPEENPKFWSYRNY
jgi:uncharacterized protein YxeA